MGFADEDGTVTRPALQGGIVSMYYAGALFGAFVAGAFSDAYGRKFLNPTNSPPPTSNPDLRSKLRTRPLT